MSEKLSIVHEWRTVHVSLPSSALVQSVLEEACRLLHIADATQVKLVQEKGSKPIDHSLTLRVASIKAANKLAIMKLPASHSTQVSVTIGWHDATHTALFPLSATLWDVLSKMDAEQPVPPRPAQPAAAAGTGTAASASVSPFAVGAAASGTPRWTGWVGIPAPEVTAQFEVHINVAGLMAPALDVGAGRRIIGEADLRATTLANLGVASDTAAPGKVKLRLSHVYQAPQRSDQEKQDIMATFQRKYAQMMAGGGAIGVGAPSSGAGASHTAAASASARAAAAAAANDEVEDDDDEDDDVAASPPPVSIPADRGLKVLHALPGMLPPPELPEEFYEVTEEDSLAYARTLRAETMKLNRSAALANHPPTALPLDPAHAHASVAALAHEAHLKKVAHLPDGGAPVPRCEHAHEGANSPAGHKHNEPLLDSHRLPAAPSRSARRKRACHATLLRVRLPNHLYVEGLFRADETPAQLYAWMDSLLLPAGAAAAASTEPAAGGAAQAASVTLSLNDGDAAAPATPSRDYYLYITPPRQVLSRSSRLTFAQLGLLPMALVHFGLSGENVQSHAAGAFVVAPDTEEERARKEANPAVGMLRPEIAAKTQRIEPPPPQPQPAPTEAADKPEEEEKKSEAADATMQDKA